MSMIPSVPIGSSVSFLANPNNFDVDHFHVTFDNHVTRITQDELNKTQDQDGLFEFFSMQTNGTNLHTVMIWKTNLGRPGGWNIVAIVYVMLSLIISFSSNHEKSFNQTEVLKGTSSTAETHTSTSTTPSFTTTVIADHPKSAIGRVNGTIVGIVSGGLLTVAFICFLLLRHRQLETFLRIRRFFRRGHIVGVTTNTDEENVIDRVRRIIPLTVSNGEKKVTKDLPNGQTAAL